MDAVRVALLREVLAGTEWLSATRRFAATLRGSVVSYGGGLLLVGTAEYEPWHLAAHLADEAAWSGTPELSPTLVRHVTRAADRPHLSVGLGRLEAVRRGETLLVVAPETPEGPGSLLLERVHDARRSGATILALGGTDRDLETLSHEALEVPGSPATGPDGLREGPRDGLREAGLRAAGGIRVADEEETQEEGTQEVGTQAGRETAAAMEVRTDLGLDIVQHLVSAAAGENSLPSPRRGRRFRDRLVRLADQLTSPPPPPW